MANYLKYLSVIENSALFRGLTETDVLLLLEELSVRCVDYDKGVYILQRGDLISTSCMVLRGSVCVQRIDYWGRRNIISNVTVGQVFAEAYATAEAPLLFEVVANEDSTILFLDIHKILTGINDTSTPHQRLIRNFSSDLAAKAMQMNEKLTHITQRTTREKLMSFFSAEAQRLGKTAFDIHFNRQQLADYLAVDRSAMCAELSRMQADGLLTCRKNHITLLDRTDTYRY